MAIRVCRTRDLALVHELDTKLLSPVATQATLASTTWWLVKQDGEPVGFAGARMDKHGWCYFDRCGVLRKARGQRLQQRLIQARIRWARKQGALGCYTYTLPSRPASQNSMIRAGFRTFWPAVPFCGNDVVYWRKRF